MALFSFGRARGRANSDQVDVLTIGSALQDVILETREGKIFETPEIATASRHLGFEFGAKIPVDTGMFGIGGGASNAVVAMSRLGLRVAPCVRVGHDSAGDHIVSEFQAQQIVTDYVQFDSQAHTGISTLIVKQPEAEHILFPYRGANAYLEVDRDLLERVSPRAVYVTSLHGDSVSDVERVISVFAQEHPDVLVAMNPGAVQISRSVELFVEMVRHLTVLILNKDEAIEVVGKRARVSANLSVKNLLDELRAMGPRIVVITDGDHGASVSWSDQYRFAPSLRVDMVDSTGAGDAFGATFVALLLRSEGNVESALVHAIANSASAVTIAGAQTGFLSLGELESLAKKVSIQSF